MCGAVLAAPRGAPAQLRSRIDPALGRLTFGSILEFLKGVIDHMPERPAVVGHSIGGLLTQCLVRDGYAASAVVISSAPPFGVLEVSGHFVRANLPHVNPLAGNRPVEMTRDRFHYAFANTVGRAASDELFDRFVVPESRNIPRSILLPSTRIDFQAPHVPMLFLAGDTDRLTPFGMVNRNAGRYAPEAGPLEFRKVPDRSHALCLEPGWEEVADQAIDWVT